MNESIFYIDYCLNIYSKPVIWDGEVKKYNIETGRFESISTEDKNFTNNAIEISIDAARDVIKNTFHSLYSNCLKYEDEKWLERFEFEITKRPYLKENDELVFNYVILKANIAGVPDYISVQLYSNFFANKKEERTTQSIDDILNKLNFYRNKKRFWIPDIKNELAKEFSIIDDIMLKRISEPNFKFNFFESRYLSICNDGFLKKIWYFNKTKNKYVLEDFSEEELRNFLFKYYKKTIDEFIDNLSEKYLYFKSNPASKTMIYKNMEDITKYSMKFWGN